AGTSTVTAPEAGRAGTSTVAAPARDLSGTSTVTAPADGRTGASTEAELPTGCDGTSTVVPATAAGADMKGSRRPSDGSRSATSVSVAGAPTTASLVPSGPVAASGGSTGAATGDPDSERDRTATFGCLAAASGVGAFSSGAMSTVAGA